MSDRALTCDAKNLDDWLETNTISSHLREKGSDPWIAGVVRIADYMANSFVIKKNKVILDELIENYFPILDKNHEWLKKM